jgi:putative N6-adenine-specific DNA methylase
MCGSGTLAIEHALAARRIAPGLGRAFGFQRWPVYRGALQSTWDRMKEEARRIALPAAPAPIVARDLFTKALDAARRNAAAAGVLADIRFERGDVRELAPEPGMDAGAVCMNPPYGERLMGKPGAEERGRATGPRSARGASPSARSRGEGRGEESRHDDRREAHVSQLKLQGLYRGMADAFGQFHGWSVVLLSGSPLLEAAMHVKPEVSHRLWNGPLEVRLLRYRVR